MENSPRTRSSRNIVMKASADTSPVEKRVLRSRNVDMSTEKAGDKSPRSASSSSKKRPSPRSQSRDLKKSPKKAKRRLFALSTDSSSGVWRDSTAGDMSTESCINNENDEPWCVKYSPSAASVAKTDESMEIVKSTVVDKSTLASPRRSPRIKCQPAPMYAENGPPPADTISPTKSRTPTKTNAIRSPRRRHEATLGGTMQNVLEQTENLKLDDDEDGDRLVATRRLLWHDETPDEFVHREAEIQKIATFIADFIGGDTIARTLFLAGVPGTGKTSCVLRAIKDLYTMPGMREAFKFVNLNGGQMLKPDELYTHLHSELIDSERRAAPKTARAALCQFFAIYDPERLPILLLVDELDFLLTRKQNVIYDLLEWATTERARIAVIAVANTFDFPTRCLQGKMQSRLGTNCVIFQPYSWEQLRDIVQQRLESRVGAVLAKSVIVLAAKRVANMNGDVRNVLDILRRSVDIAIEASASSVEMKHYEQAFIEQRANYRSMLIRSLGEDSFIMLQAAYETSITCPCEEMTFGRVFRRYEELCANFGRLALDVFAATDVVLVGERLGLYDVGSTPATFSRRIALAIGAAETRMCIESVKNESKII